MAAFLWWVSGDWSEWTGWHATRRALWLGISVVGGGVVYFGVLALAGARPRDLKHL
jgi:peptidoglycan biosynthesis protein MviN/MurJ (putative lipid II flippase)